MIFELDEDALLVEEFQHNLSLNSQAQPVAISLQHRRKSSNRNTPQHRLGTSFEFDIDSTLGSHTGSWGKPKPADFQAIKVLGVGSYGKVILVKETKTGKLFAQKQLKKASLIIQSKTVQRTMTEKEILESVNHRSIVKLFYSFQDDSKLYLILEYLPGGELFQHLQQEKFISEDNCAVYLAQIILGLEHLHKIGIVYRDLKPENVLLNADGYLVLTDFGLSKVGLNDADDKCTSLIGTPEYMAPEILQNIPYDFKVDFWSLGCVMFDMLTGQPPFTGNNNKKIMDKIVANKLKIPYYLSQDAKDLLTKLLRKNPEKRLSDFDAIKTHRFFRKISWPDIENHRFTPPIIPIITDPILAENFDSDFTEMAITPPATSPLGSLEMPAQPAAKLGEPTNPFSGFSYTDNTLRHIYS